MKNILALVVVLGTIGGILVGCAKEPITYVEKSLDLAPNVVMVPKGYKIHAVDDYGSKVYITHPDKPGEIIAWSYINDTRTIYKEQN